jgi:curved DNA-binding protein CbpA
MELKDYYRILGIAQGASSAEIRDAFRTLAKKYHPDIAQDNPHATAHFKEIREAYECLAHPARRAAYDEDRWLRGMSQRSRHPRSLSADWVLQEARRLRRHMSSIDSYRMNHEALRDYVRALLSPEHLSVLRETAEHRSLIIDELMGSLVRMRYEYAESIKPELMMVSEELPSQRLRIHRWLNTRKTAAREVWVLPLLVFVMVIAFCVLMWSLRR